MDASDVLTRGLLLFTHRTNVTRGSFTLLIVSSEPMAWQRHRWSGNELVADQYRVKYNLMNVGSLREQRVSDALKCDVRGGTLH